MFWENFARLCVERGEFPNVVATKCGVTSTGTVTGWKKGATPRDKFLNRFAEYFGVTVEDLLSDEHPGTDFSSSEAAIIKKYRTLDERGKRMVDMVLDAEAKEVEADEPDNVVEIPQTKDIPLFEDTFAAGRGDVGFSNLFVNYSVPIDSRADFAIRVNGNSMEPYLHDGSIALCRKEKPRDGDVGAFLLDGAYVCKQVCVDVRGTVHLFSLNRERRDADQSIEYEDSAERLYCFGTVMMDKRVPLPLD